MGLSVGDLKDILGINKFFLAAVVLWGLVVASVELVVRWQACNVVQGLEWFGFFLGGVASLADMCFELVEDVKHVLAQRRANVAAPTDVYWTLGGKDCKVPGGLMVGCALLVSETVLRIIGNVFLFVFLSFASLYKWTSAESCHPVLDPNWSAVFGIGALVLCVLRLFFAFTYPPTAPAPISVKIVQTVGVPPNIQDVGVPQAPITVTIVQPVGVPPIRVQQQQ